MTGTMRGWALALVTLVVTMLMPTGHAAVGPGAGGGGGSVTGSYSFAYPLVLSGTSVTATATITNNDSRALQTLGSGFTNRNTNARLVAESSGGGSANVQIADPDFFGLFSTAQLGFYWTNTAGQLFFYGSSDAGNTVANVATFSPTNIFFNTNVYVGTLDAADRLVRYGELAAAGAGNLHSNAVTYANSLGLTNRAAIERVSKFFWTLQDGGLLSGSGTRFYDSIFLKGGMNSEASLAARYSFLGKLGTNWSTPVQTDGGMTVGSGGYDFAIDDVSTNFSVIFFGQTGTTGQLASSHIFSLTSSSGATNQGISIGHNGVNSTIVTKTAADGSAFANNYFGHLYTDYLMAAYGFPFSAGFGYVRSGGLITNYMNGYVITNSANNPTLNDLSVLTFGGRLATLAPGWEGFWNGTAEGALIFTGQLSTNQLIFVDRAIRHLRPGNIDRLVIGDSTSANIYTKQTESWAYQWMTGPGTNEGMTRIFAMSGRRLDSMDDLFDDTAGRWGPHLTGNRTIINLWGGINDFYNSRTAQQAWQEVTNIVRKARASRIEVEIGTLYPSVILDATQETHRQNFNGLILSNANLFTKIYRRDAMFSVTNGPLWYDFLHLSTNGNALVVEDMRRGGELGWQLSVSNSLYTAIGSGSGGGGTNFTLFNTRQAIITNTLDRLTVTYSANTNIVWDWNATNVVTVSPSNTFTVSQTGTPPSTMLRTGRLRIINTNSTAGYFFGTGPGGSEVTLLTAPSTNDYTISSFNGVVEIVSHQVSEIGTNAYMRTRTGVRRTIIIDASYILTNGLTQGAIPTTYVSPYSSSNAMANSALYFDTDATNATFSLTLPPEYDRNDITLAPVWAATNGSGNVVFQFATTYAENNETFNVAYGANANSTDALTPTDGYHIGPSVTPTYGNPASTLLGNVQVRVRRSRDHASDTLNAGVFLLRVLLQYTESTTEPTALP